jgi:hypothetical protein
MNRTARLARIFASALTLTLALPLAAGGQDDDGRTLHWREFVVRAHLDAEGRLHVRERQAMVFSGDWNGGERKFDVRAGQELRFEGMERIAPATGARTRLTEGGLDDVDEYDWSGDETLRWRSRLPSDPPFRNQEILYEIAYALWPVLLQTGGDSYELRHEFSIPDRIGSIERFDLELTLDQAWAAEAGDTIRAAAEHLPPGDGYVLTLPLRYAAERAAEGGPGVPNGAATSPADGGQAATLPLAFPPAPPPLTAPPPAAGWVRAAVAAGALLVPLLLLLALRGKR